MVAIIIVPTKVTSSSHSSSAYLLSAKLNYTVVPTWRNLVAAFEWYPRSYPRVDARSFRPVAIILSPLVRSDVIRHRWGSLGGKTFSGGTGTEEGTIPQNHRKTRVDPSFLCGFFSRAQTIPPNCKKRREVKVDDSKCWCRTHCSHTKTAKTKQFFAIAQTTKRYKNRSRKKIAKAQVKI
jgi:hypothetical protein